MRKDTLKDLEEFMEYIRTQEERYKILWDWNLIPENQHMWDEMLRLEGYISGLHRVYYFAKHGSYSIKCKL